MCHSVLAYIFVNFKGAHFRPFHHHPPPIVYNQHIPKARLRSPPLTENSSEIRDHQRTAAVRSDSHCCFNDNSSTDVRRRETPTSDSSDHHNAHHTLTLTTAPTHWKRVTIRRRLVSIWDGRPVN